MAMLLATSIGRRGRAKTWATNGQNTGARRGPSLGEISSGRTEINFSLNIPMS